MNLSKIRIKCAEIVGAKWYLHASGYSWLSFSKLDDHPQWTAIEKPLDLSKIVIGDSVPSYHGSLDAIVPVVRAMPTAKRTAVLCVLCANTADTEAAMTATPDQWCEAYLKAEGLWKECKCTLRGSLLGDGCEVCNPSFAAELQKAK